MTQTCSLKHAAVTLGVHRNTLSDWLAKGCPAVTRADRARGIEWELSIPAIFEWRNDYLVREAVSSYQSEAGHITKDEADRRRAVAMAIVAEVEAYTVMRSVVAIADVESCQADFCQVLRSALDNSTAKIAGRTATMTNPNEIRDFCEAEISRSFRVAKEDLDRLWGDVKDGRLSEASEPLEDEA